MNFIADGMLGGLARWLRLMGYDTLYFNRSKIDELLRVAYREKRVILTRNRRFVRSYPDISVLIESEDVLSQMKEIKQKLSLTLNPEKFFTRCSLCNYILEKKEKDNVINLVPEYVYTYKNKFSQCPGCRRIYWDGDHCIEIRKVLKSLKET
ncbi:MAG: Mut7-C RNAse domain-containing protein [Candidatus Marinimicrobia bacterium]|nr:Mut7-C RNAse domain-containing protein [Candidatus Neomarinimicrobiota bacterium]